MKIDQTELYRDARFLLRWGVVMVLRKLLHIVQY